MGKCCLDASSYIFDRIIIKVAGNHKRHKSSDVFDFGLDQTTHFGVTCPWMTKLLHIRTWISLRPVGQSGLNFMCSFTWVGKGCLMSWGRLDQTSGVHGNRKPPLTYNGENGVSTFSWLLLSRSFLYFQIARTCINLARVREATIAHLSKKSKGQSSRSPIISPINKSFETHAVNQFSECCKCLLSELAFIFSI